MNAISRLYPVLSMLPLAAVAFLVGMAVVRQGVGDMEPTATMFAVGVLALIGAAATVVLNPRH